MSAPRGGLKGMEQELERLRAGEASLAQLRPALQPHLQKLASYWCARYAGKQTLLEVEDLVSLGEVAVWRAVDTWDPARRSLGDYVLCAVGRAMEKELKRAAGWPDPRRPAPATQVYLSEMGGGRKRPIGDGVNNSMARRVERLMVEAIGLPMQALQERRVEAKERVEGALQHLPEGLERHVVELVLRGYTVSGAAAMVYGSPRLRRYYGLRSPAHSERVVRAAAGRAQRHLEAAEL